MTTATEINTAVAPEPPRQNPATVIVTCPIACAVHGWTPGACYNTIPVDHSVDAFRDSNGFNIYVESVFWKRPVWLSTNEYKTSY